MAQLAITFLFPLVTMVSQENADTIVPCACGRCLGFPAALVIFVTQSVFLAAQDPITPLLATAAAGLINLGGDYIACNVLGMGIAGAALATAAAQVLRRPLPNP